MARGSLRAWRQATRGHSAGRSQGRLPLEHLSRKTGVEIERTFSGTGNSNATLIKSDHVNDNENIASSVGLST